MRALSDLAAASPKETFTVEFGAAQLQQIAGRTEISVAPTKVELPETVTSPVEEPGNGIYKPVSRRNKEEMDAGLTLEQANERRKAGLSVDEYLALDSDANDAEPPVEEPVEIDATPPAKTEDEKLADQPGMSVPPSGSSEATVDDIRLVVGKLLAEGKKDVVVTYTAKLGVERLSAADASQYGSIVDYLSAQLDEAKTPLV